jgi:hypothetical protein
MSIISHILELFCLVIIYIGPLPLCLWFIWLLGKKDKNNKSGFAHFLLVLIVCWCVLEISIGIILGIFHLLNFTTLLLAEIIVFSAGMGFLLSFKRSAPFLYFKDLMKIPQKFNSFEKLILGVISFVCIILLWNIMTFPIKDYDSLAYHLPVMAKWYQTGSFSMLEQFGQISRYPYNWEVLCTLHLFPFKRDFLVAFPNLIAWGLFGLSIYLLGLKIGAARINSLAISCLALSIPIVLRNVNTLHIDLVFAAFFMASLYLLVHTVHTMSTKYFALSLSTLGLFLGIKTSGFIYGLILMAVFILMIFKSIYFDKQFQNFSFKSYRTGIFHFVFGGMFFLLLGGFWYLRNFVETGNPIGNMKVQIGNLLIFPGTIESKVIYRTTLAKTFDSTNLSHWKTVINQMDSQLGIPFFVMMFLVFVLITTFFIDKKSIRIYTFIGLSTLLVITFVIFWITPYSGTNKALEYQLTPWFGQAIRYAFPFIGLFAVLSAAGAGGTKRISIHHLTIATVVLIGSISGLYRLGYYFGIKGNKVLYIATFLLLLIGINRIILKKLVKYPIILYLLILSLILTITWIAREKRDTNRYLFYGSVVDYIEKHTDLNEKIGYIYSHRSYLFYGEKFNRKVLYIPARNKTFLQWIKTLREKDIRLIAIGPMRKEWQSKKELKWLTNPKVFNRVFGGLSTKGVTIYQLKDLKEKEVN